MNAFVLVVSLSLLLPASVLVAHADSGQATFDMQPAYPDPHNPVTRSYFVIDGQPATHMDSGIRVTNTGSARGMVNLYPVDAFTAPTGGTAYRTQKDARRDVGAWITLTQQQVTLAPGQSRIVSFHLTLPAHVRAGQHIGGIVAEGATSQPIVPYKDAHLTQVSRRIVAVQVNLPGTPIEQLTTTGIQIDSTSIYQRLLIALNNTGTMMIHPSGVLHVYDEKGHRLQNRTLHLDTFLPQTSIRYPVYLLHQQALPIGRYMASLTLRYEHQGKVDYTTAFTVTAQKQTLSNAIATLVTLGPGKDFFDIVSPWQVAVGGGILLLIIGAGVYRLFLTATHRQRRNAEQKHIH